MAKFVHEELETCPYNNDGSCLALYFEGTPTEEEIAKACDEGKTPLGVDGDPDWEIKPNVLSKRAGLVRVLVFNIG